jgi:Flp pilus assembly CpaE family ATPase/DNA-binding NarL/FixJ family response regulator
MAENISVLIVDDISSTLDNLRKLLSFEEDIDVVSTAVNGREAIDECKRLHPDIVEMDGIQATEALAAEAPNSPVIIMSVQGERDYLRRAMQSGAREFLIKPFSGDELVASIRRVHQLEQRKETYSRGAAGSAPAAPARPAKKPAATPQAGPPAEPAEAPSEAAAGAQEEAVEAGVEEATVPAAAVASNGAGVAEASEAVVEEAEVEPADAPEAPAPVEAPRALRTVPGELIVLYGGKGGVGKSVLAVNLACAISRETGAHVALVDLDLQFGDIGVLLNLPQSQSIADLVQEIDQMDADFIRDVMPMGPADIRVLPTAPSPELADLVGPEHVVAILAQLRVMFDFVVVDTSSHLGDVTLAALDAATRIMLVSTLSIPAVKNAKLALRLFETLSIPTSNITLVLNRSEAHTEFNKESIESNLKFPVAIQIPHDPRTVVNSINRGIPFVVTNPEAEASQRIRELVGMLQAEGAEAPAGQGRGRRRFGRR